MEDNYVIEAFGKFDDASITAIVDHAGNYWFTPDVIANALDIDKSALTHIRQNHPGEFQDSIDYMSIVWEGKRRVVYSEEGFLTICDMSTSENAYRLRKWMRQQFRVKQHGREVVVHSRSNVRDDLSDLGQDMVALQRIVDAIAEDRRSIMRLKETQAVLHAEQQDIEVRVATTEDRLQEWEDGAKVKPGEMTAIQLAVQIGWHSNAGGPHNLAVILAAFNARFDEKGLMERRREQGPDGLEVEVFVFSPKGVAKFINDIDSKHAMGKRFQIAPDPRSLGLGYKNTRTVHKY